MNDKELLDIYTDYLISSLGPTTKTGLSRLLDGAISHNRLQRFLANPTKGGKRFRARFHQVVRIAFATLNELQSIRLAA